MAEKVKGVPSELTLCRIDNQPMLAEPEEGPEVGQVLLFRGARDEDVIQVDEEEGQVLEHRVHEALEGLRRVPQAEGHPQKLEETEEGDDGCIRDVLWVHRHLMVLPWMRR